MHMEPKPLLFPYLYDDLQIDDHIENESTSIFDIPQVRAKLANERTYQFDAAKAKTIVLRNRRRIKGIILRNEFARLYVQTETDCKWIAKTQIRHIY